MCHKSLLSISAQTLKPHRSKWLTLLSATEELQCANFITTIYLWLRRGSTLMTQGGNKNPKLALLQTLLAFYSHKMKDIRSNCIWTLSLWDHPYIKACSLHCFSIGPCLSIYWFLKLFALQSVSDQPSSLWVHIQIKSQVFCGKSKSILYCRS